ncbi:MAG: epoxyqueuosine reductase QueH, partial [Anaerovorax sp.]
FAEYEKRKEAQVAFLDGYNASLEWEEKIAFQEGPYAVTQFAELVKGLENEAEGGKRCDLCFRHRLEETAKLAHLNAYDCFSTTLSVSPHKDFQKISLFGNQLSLAYQVAFLDENFKKKDGYQRSIQLSKEYKLYRQTYCGCKFINGGYER